MRDLDYLKLLSHEYPSADEAAAEIINLRALCGMPKGTEYFFSDLHGEHQAFIHMMRSCSGSIKSKLRETFGDSLSEEEQLELAELIYYPERHLKHMVGEPRLSMEWQEKTILQLVQVTRVCSKKFTRRKIRQKLPKAYAHIIDELLHAEGDYSDKDLYYHEMLQAVLQEDVGYEIIHALCSLIRDILIDKLHIIGDIFDRGPRPDLIMDELMNLQHVDVQWGNHDVSWMGAAAGNPACIATVLRIATAYNCFDVLEDGYGINLRPLSMFADQTYHDDDCACFRPHLLDENLYDEINPDLAAKICKAISVIEFKVESQLIQRHPEYHMNDRLLLNKVNWEKGTITIGGKRYPMKDTSFPTIDPSDPSRLSAEEKELMDVLISSFRHSERLQNHIRFLFSHGSMYLIRNGNLLYHGCVPMNEDGSFKSVNLFGKPLKAQALMDEIERRCINAFFTQREGMEDPYATDLFWYLWCGADSPLFGKNRMATFENFFLDEPSLKKEEYNPYYQFSTKKEYAEKILESFGLDPSTGHIINGHVPVKVRKGETPVKARGKLFVIDGGISKAYQQKTGIAGYTLIFNSHYLALAEHKPFLPGEEDTPTVTVVDEFKERFLLKDTDDGKEYLHRIADLEDLLSAYRSGLIKQPDLKQ